MASRPNLLVILADQFRADTMGSMGHPNIRTPNIDRLAEEGVTFTRCSTNAPLCMPARTSFTSGLYVNQHGVWDNEGKEERQGPSHVRNIRDAGYHTAVVGKTSLYAYERGSHTSSYVDRLQDLGYTDITEAFGRAGALELYSPYTDYLAERGLLAAWREHNLEYKRRRDLGELPPWEESPLPYPVEHHPDSFIGRKSVEWIENFRGPEPFYLQLVFNAPHPPFDVGGEYRELYNSEDLPRGITDRPEEPLASYVAKSLKDSALGDMTVKQRQLMRAFYYGGITLLDDQVGKILNALEKRGFLDNTWLIFSSDHGEMLGDHNLIHKSVFYESAINVPCVVRPPGGVRGWKSGGLVEHVDLTASLLDLAGAKPLARCQGRSLAPQIAAGPEGLAAQKGKEVVYSEFKGYSMARTERCKIGVHSFSQRIEELYDLANDPQELRNLVKDPACEGVRKEMMERYMVPFLADMDKSKAYV